MTTVHSTGNDGKPPWRKGFNILKGDTIILDLTTAAGRYAARALAYYLMAEDFATFQRIIEKVGREG